MFKVELDSSYSDARKLGECFVGCEVEFPETGEGALEGIHDNRFLVVEYEIDYEMYLPLKITLDLSTSKPNIWKLVEHGFLVEVNFMADNCDGFYYDFRSNFRKMEFLNHQDMHGEIKSIKILDLDKLDGVREVSE